MFSSETPSITRVRYANTRISTPPSWRRECTPPPRAHALNAVRSPVLSHLVPCCTMPCCTMPCCTMPCCLWCMFNSCYGDYCRCEGMRSTVDATSSDRVRDRRGQNGWSLSVPAKLVPYRSILRSRAEEKALSLRPKPQTSASDGRETFERTSTPGSDLADLRASKVRCMGVEYVIAVFKPVSALESVYSGSV